VCVCTRVLVPLVLRRFVLLPSVFPVELVDRLAELFAPMLETRLRVAPDTDRGTRARCRARGAPMCVRHARRRLPMPPWRDHGAQLLCPPHTLTMHRALLPGCRSGPLLSQPAVYRAMVRPAPHRAARHSEGR